MSTLSLPALRRVPINSTAAAWRPAATLMAGFERLLQSGDRRRHTEAEQRMAAAIAANGGLLTDDLERRLMPGGRG